MRARDAVRALIKDGLSDDITVHIAGGTYSLDETLEFGPQDSGTDEHAITYCAETGKRAVFSGGRVISGWNRDEDGLWRCRIPEVAQGTWWFRQLLRGETRLPRS